MKSYLYILSVLLLMSSNLHALPQELDGKKLTIEQARYILQQSGYEKDVVDLKKNPAEFSQNSFKFTTLKDSTDEQICDFMTSAGTGDFYDLQKPYTPVVPDEIYSMPPEKAVELLFEKNCLPFFNKMVKRNWSIDTESLKKLPEKYRVIQDRSIPGCMSYRNLVLVLNVEPKNSFISITKIPFIAGVEPLLNHQLKVYTLSYQQAHHLGQLLWLIENIKFDSSIEDRALLRRFISHGSFYQSSFRFDSNEVIKLRKGDLWGMIHYDHWKGECWTNVVDKGVVINFSALLIDNHVKNMKDKDLLCTLHLGSDFFQDTNEEVDFSIEDIGVRKRITEKLKKLIRKIPHKEEFASVLTVISAFTSFYNIKEMLPVLEELHQKLSVEFARSREVAENNKDAKAIVLNFEYCRSFQRLENELLLTIDLLKNGNRLVKQLKKVEPEGNEEDTYNGDNSDNKPADEEFLQRITEEKKRKELAETGKYEDVARYIRQKISENKTEGVFQILHDILFRDCYIKRYLDEDYPQLLKEVFRNNALNSDKFYKKQILYYLIRRGCKDLDDLIDDYASLVDEKERGHRRNELKLLALLYSGDFSENGRAEMASLMKRLFAANWFSEELLEIAWILDMQELKPYLQKIATSDREEQENLLLATDDGYRQEYISGEWRLKSHLSRQILQIFSEKDPITKARLMVALKNHFKPLNRKLFDEATKERFEALKKQNPEIKINFDEKCPKCGQNGQGKKSLDPDDDLEEFEEYEELHDEFAETEEIAGDDDGEDDEDEYGEDDDGEDDDGEDDEDEYGEDFDVEEFDDEEIPERDRIKIFDFVW